jgi:hypothetical protein
MDEQKDMNFTFSDEDFERRYSSGESSTPTPAPDSSTGERASIAARIVRSRNRYMRTLLRRRLSSSRTI